MHNIKKAVPAARAKSHAPVAPSDLWVQLDAIVLQHKEHPKNSFTVAEFADKYGLPRSTAKYRINSLLLANKIRKIGEIYSSHAIIYGLVNGEEKGDN